MFGNQATPAPFTARVQARLLASAGPLPVSVDLRYRASDPYAVTADFHTGDRQVVTWTFARDLFKTAASTPNGNGDVQVWTTGAHFYLSLTSPSGSAQFELDAAPVLNFVAVIFRMVPAGDESRWLDIDGAIRQLFDS